MAQPIKGRKRERVYQDSDSIKRERSSADDNFSSQFRFETALNLEVSTITENGGLVDVEGVEKLVQLMQTNIGEKKLELASKSIFVGVVAATENIDCLSRFVQLKGLHVLDQWLQDIHKGKLDVDKSIEEFLFILLRALDKLPVNLQALQNCKIGKSVNHLRTYKNIGIKKKARSLIDTWKKRVDADLYVIETKSRLNRAVLVIDRPPEKNVTLGSRELDLNLPIGMNNNRTPYLLPHSIGKTSTEETDDSMQETRTLFSASTVQSEIRLTVKANCGGNFFIFQLFSSSGIHELSQQVAQRLNLEFGTYDVKYLDDENDFILIVCDDDLQQYISTSISKGRYTLKMIIEPRNAS